MKNAHTEVWNVTRLFFSWLFSAGILKELYIFFSNSGDESSFQLRNHGIRAKFWAVFYHNILSAK